MMETQLSGGLVTSGPSVPEPLPATQLALPELALPEQALPEQALQAAEQPFPEPLPIPEPLSVPEPFPVIEPKLEQHSQYSTTDSVKDEPCSHLKMGEKMGEMVNMGGIKQSLVSKTKSGELLL